MRASHLLAPIIVGTLIIMPTAQAKQGDELIGKEAPGWELQSWLNSKPIKLDDLRGKVVLVRWWTGPNCPYCSSSAPALNEWHTAYANRGLAVIGMYHPKPLRSQSIQEVKRFAKQKGFEFPIALDMDWKELHRWWLHTKGRRWTSISFLINKKGTIRYIHPGGEYHKGGPHTPGVSVKECEKTYHEMKSLIENLLEEPTQDRPISSKSKS